MADRIVDYVSKISVEKTPEEGVVQKFSRILVEDYRYPKKELRTHLQVYVKSCPSDPKGYPIDIAVYEKGKMKIVVECKKPNRKDGRQQLEIYLKFCEASIGVWYNGSESLYLRKNKESGNIHFEEMESFPRYGETIPEMGKYRKSQLDSTHNLKEIFSEIRGYLVANATGTTRNYVR